MAIGAAICAVTGEQHVLGEHPTADVGMIRWVVTGRAGVVVVVVVFFFLVGRVVYGQGRSLYLHHHPKLTSSSLSSARDAEILQRKEKKMTYPG